MRNVFPINDDCWISNPRSRAEELEKGSHRRSWSKLIMLGYRFRRLRPFLIRVGTRIENGRFYSRTLRSILERFHGVKVGPYSYGPILTPGVLPPGTRVGAYCSVGTELIVRRRNHPVERLTQHPFFYALPLGYLTKETVQPVIANPLTIGHDVWIGDRVTILAGCKSIGNGAVLAAGAVITRDVAPYTIVAGVPARTIRMRFDEATIRQIEQSHWWDMPLEALLEHRDILLQNLTAEVASRLNPAHENKP